MKRNRSRQRSLSEIAKDVNVVKNLSQTIESQSRGRLWSTGRAMPRSVIQRAAQGRHEE